jgi:hypothetical protein
MAPLPVRIEPKPDVPAECSALDDADRALFWRLVGVAAVTQVFPHFAFAASLLGTRRSRPTRYDLTLATRAVRCLIGARLDFLRLERGTDLPGDWESRWDCDSDWAGDKDTFRSHGGHHGTWGGLPLLSRSGRQKSMARSSSAAEIMQLSTCGADIVVHRRTAGFLRHPPSQPALCHADNAASIKVAEQQIVLTAIARHVAVRYLYIRELVGHGVVTLLWVSSARNVADVFTKPLHPALFFAFKAVVVGLDRLWRYF